MGGCTAYRAAAAEGRAWRQGRRAKRCRLATHRALRRAVATKLAQQWSPQQISGWLRHTFPSDPAMQVSPETIYRSLFIQSRGVLKRVLLGQLRRQHPYRQTRGSARARPRPGADPGRRLDSRAAGRRRGPRRTRVIGRATCWKAPEAPTLRRWSSANPATCCSCACRTKKRQTVIGALARRIRRLPHGLVKSLTWDRGTESAGHRRFTVATDVQVNLCDPHSPWQRGSNENTNGLLQQYLPPATNLSAYSQARLDTIALRLNTRPRLTLGYRTPAAKLAEIVASMG